MKKHVLLGLVLLGQLGLAGCGDADPAANPPDSMFIAGFTPPALQPGYTRYVAPAVRNLKPGTDIEYCQWITVPVDREQDVLSVIGSQSRGGHHAVLYASTRTNVPVGDSHVCTEDDMISFSFLGAIGAEGTATDITGLPDGLYFRLRKGLSLVINTHYLNASQSEIEGQAVLDVKFAEPSPEHRVADLFANNGAGFVIEPGATGSYDANCELKQDMQFAMLTNHMHEFGTAAMSEIVKKDGTRVPVIRDDVWRDEQKFNPVYARFSLAQPLTAAAGDVFHTRCTWKNTTSTPLAFPREMCAGVGFYFPGNGMISCSDGEWSAQK